jgi:hypothetical protein
MFIFNATPHNKLILICDKVAYVAPPFKNLDFDATDVSIYGHQVTLRYAVSSPTNDPQWDISVYAKAAMQSKHCFVKRVQFNVERLALNCDTPVSNNF